MQKFLELVALAYQRHEGAKMARYCFVFPNKRSGQYFLHHLRVCARRPLPTPEVTTMGEFVTQFSDLLPASPEDQIFTLYNAYRKINKGASDDFDRFRFWGEMLIKDFEDIDNYMADASRLLRNVTTYQEIQSDYLTEAQKEIINKYWPESFREAAADGEGSSSWARRFWKHVSPGDEKKGKAGHRFLSLWQSLGALYRQFRHDLRDAGMATQAMFSRDAAELLSGPDGQSALRRDRYVFVGFNQLTTAELSVMETIRRLGNADFYWKFHSLLPGADSRAATFVERYAASFKSLYDIERGVEMTMPESIDIVSVASRVGQADIAADYISRWRAAGQVGDSNSAIYTAIVIPDEGLLIPTVNALAAAGIIRSGEQPGDDTGTGMPFNATMGLPYRQTPVSALMREIVSLNLRAAKSGGQRIFFHEDIKNLLTNPYVRSLCADDADRLLSDMNNRRVFKIAQSEIFGKYPTLEPFFSLGAGVNTFENTYDYLNTIVTYLTENSASEGFERIFMDAYRGALERLRDAVRRNSIEMRDAAVFKMIERVIASLTFNIEGKPLRGLQVMGVLETRALDFDNIVILSMNENSFPRRFQVRSFIPENIRRGYGLPTIRFEESLYAYYFYSMISRARNVALVYDSRQGGMRSGEMSRYIYQLLYNPDVKPRHLSSMSGGGNPPEERKISVRKTDEIMAKLGRFLSPAPEGVEQAHLSPSAINKYINCPLDFYLSYVENLNADENATEYMDAGTYGSVVHKVAERMYEVGRTYDRQALTAMIEDARVNRDKGTGHLCRIIRETINEYRHPRIDRSTELKGDDRVLSYVINKNLTEMMTRELDFTPFTVVGTERRILYDWEIGGRKVSFVVIIDRIDRVEGPDGPTLRFVDYKTGSDITRFKVVDDLFVKGSHDRAKAILQLFIYCNIYRLSEGYEGPIQPILYKLRTLYTEGLTPLRHGSEELTDYRGLNDEVMEGLGDVISEIFDPEKPFEQAPDAKSCKFCGFKAICGREEARDY